MVQSAAYKEMLNINNYIREVNLKTTKRYQLTLIKMATVKDKKKKTKQKATSAGEDVDPCTLLVGM